MAAIFPHSPILPACQKWFSALRANSRPGGFPIFRVRVSILPRIPAGFRAEYPWTASAVWRDRRTAVGAEPFRHILQHLSFCICFHRCPSSCVVHVAPFPCCAVTPPILRKNPKKYIKIDEVNFRPVSMDTIRVVSVPFWIFIFHRNKQKRTKSLDFPRKFMRFGSFRIFKRQGLAVLPCLFVCWFHFAP